MTTFDERERGFENKFAHHKELEFKISARTNKLFGLWAAKLMNLPATEADEYAMQVVQADLQAPGNWDVIEKVTHDLKRKSHILTADAINAEYTNCRHEAEKQIRVE